MSLLVGMRKASSVEDTVKCLDIKLRAEDIKCMDEAVKTIQVEMCIRDSARTGNTGKGI